MIWLIWLRVAGFPGCKVTPATGSDALECALSADAPHDLGAILDAALRPHRYRVGELEACVAFEPDAWDDRNDPDGRVRAAAAAAREQGGVHFASFGRAPPDAAR